MSDFFTKKQRKFWCDTCKLFIEYTKLSIDQHNRSKNHLRLVNRDIEYKNQKAKFQKMHGLGTIENQNPIGNPALSVPGKPQQIDPLTGYLPEEANKNFLNKKTQRDKNQNPQQNNTNLNRNTSNNQSLNAILFDEIKKEKMQTELNRNTLDLVNRSWVMFWDYTYNLPYYFNRMTGVSQWEKPAEFDNYAFNQQQANANLNKIPLNLSNNFNSINANNLPSNNEVNITNAKNISNNNENSDSESEDELEESENSLEQVEDELEDKETAGIIGKWEVVEKDQSVFAPTKKTKDESQIDNSNPESNVIKEEQEQSVDSEEEKVKNAYYIPGLMNKAEFLQNEYGDEFDDESETSDKATLEIKSGLENVENLENRGYEDEAEKEENKYTGKASEKKELSKDDLIKINKRLKQRDYDFRYMDLKDKQDHIPFAEEPISIDIKPIKFNKPKVKRILPLNDEEE